MNHTKKEREKKKKKISTFGKEKEGKNNKFKK